MNGKEILDKYNAQPFGMIDGFVTLEEMIDTALEKQREACAEAAWELLDPVNFPLFSQNFKQAILNARVEDI